MADIGCTNSSYREKACCSASLLEEKMLREEREGVRRQRQWRVGLRGRGEVARQTLD
jgi:hypothetical protein